MLFILNQQNLLGEIFIHSSINHSFLINSNNCLYPLIGETFKISRKLSPQPVWNFVKNDFSRNFKILQMNKESCKIYFNSRIIVYNIGWLLHTSIEWWYFKLNLSNICFSYSFKSQRHSFILFVKLNLESIH